MEPAQKINMWVDWIVQKKFKRSDFIYKLYKFK